MSARSKAWRNQIQVAVTAVLLGAGADANVAGERRITALVPPPEDFFSDRFQP